MNSSNSVFFKASGAFERYLGFRSLQKHADLEVVKLLIGVNFEIDLLSRI